METCFITKNQNFQQAEGHFLRGALLARATSCRMRFAARIHACIVSHCPVGRPTEKQQLNFMLMPSSLSHDAHRLCTRLSPFPQKQVTKQMDSRHTKTGNFLIGGASQNPVVQHSGDSMNGRIQLPSSPWCCPWWECKSCMGSSSGGGLPSSLSTASRAPAPSSSARGPAPAGLDGVARSMCVPC